VGSISEQPGKESSAPARYRRPGRRSAAVSAPGVAAGLDTIGRRGLTAGLAVALLIMPAGSA